MPVASVYENGGIIGQTLDLGSTEQYISGASTPSLVGTASASGSSTLSLTGITGLQEGDLVVIWITDDTNQFEIGSTGWTTSIDLRANSIENLVAYKVMGSTVDTSVSFVDGDDLDPIILDALTATAWRNVEWGSRSGFTTASGNTINPVSSTVTTDNSVVIVLGAIDDDNSTISSPPTGYTVAVQDGRFGGSNAQMYKTGVSAGTEDPSSYTWSSTDALLSRTVILQPTISYGNFKNSGIWNLNAVFNYLASLVVDFDVIYGGFSSVIAGSRNVSYPATVNAGDLLIVTGSQNNSANVVPTGWNSHINDAYEFCYSKVATGSETGSLSITTPSAVEGVAQLILIRPKGAVLTDFFQSHTGGFISSGSISYTAQASAGDFDLYLLHAWNAATRTLSTSPSNMNLISSTNTLHRADFYEAKDISGETISTSYTSSINQRSDHFAFITNGHTSSINRINLVADPLDMNAGFFTDGARCTLSRDTTTAKSPLGGVPLKLETTGSADPFIRTYDASQYNIDTAANGETWEVRVFSKASTSTDIAIFIFGVGTNGAFINDATAFQGEAFTVGTEWEEFRSRFTFGNASVARVQSRLDGPQAGTSGISVWFDGFQIYKIS